MKVGECYNSEIHLIWSLLQEHVKQYLCGNYFIDLFLGLAGVVVNILVGPDP